MDEIIGDRQDAEPPTVGEGPRQQFQPPAPVGSCEIVVSVLAARIPLVEPALRTANSRLL